eukprot:scaffold1610_cov257-Pinguiococcus_pyrenoidosus.AAC.19
MSLIPSPLSLSHLSASNAAWAPEPALVMAWRYNLSATSPAAKTPGTDVAVVPGLVTTYPAASTSSSPFTMCVFGLCPMATNAAAAWSTSSSPL